MKILPAWRSVLKRSASVWAGYAQALLGVLTFLDPGIALAVWNQMPISVSSRVPPAFISAVGAILFGLAMLTIALRLFAQPKLQEKIDSRR